MKEVNLPYLLLVGDKIMFFITFERVIELNINKRANLLDVEKIFKIEKKLFQDFKIPKKSKNFYYEKEGKKFFPNILSLFLAKKSFKIEEAFVYQDYKNYFFSKEILDKYLNFFSSLFSKEQKEILDRKDIGDFDVFLYFPDNFDKRNINNIEKSYCVDSFFQRTYEYKDISLNNLENIEENTILFSPIIKNKNIEAEIGFAYGSIYGNVYEKYNGGMVSFGFDFFDKNIAKIKSNAEAIERFNSAWFEGYDSFEKINYYDEEESKKYIYSFLGFDFSFFNKQIPSKKIYKISASEKKFYFENKFIYTPCELIYYPHNFPIDIGYTNSNGVAAGKTLNEAIKNAFFELSERDSIMYVWLQKISPPKIPTIILSKKLKNYIKFLEERYLLNITILDISIGKKFPHILIITENKNGFYEFGAASGEDWEDVIWKALRESIISTIWYDGKHEFLQRNSEEEIIEVTDHKHYYNTGNNKVKLKFLFEGKEMRKLSNIEKEFDKYIKNSGDLFGINLTTKYSLEQYGLYVVKLFSTNFLPIWFGFKSKHQIPYNKDKLKGHKKNKDDFLHFFP